MSWIRTWWPELIVWGISLAVLAYFVLVALSAARVI